MAEIKIERVLGPAKRAVFKGLQAFNTGIVGKHEARALAITLRRRGSIVGGLIAHTVLGWMFVQAFWIADEFRGQGFGRKIMKAAEKEAKRRGVNDIYLDTFSFQAPRFYAKLGYREFGRVNDFPKGHSRHWMTKTLK
jgi:GNAT superfamily N-acetyltransferase